jgi:hypothetical protein
MQARSLQPLACIWGDVSLPSSEVIQPAKFCHATAVMRVGRRVRSA